MVELCKSDRSCDRLATYLFFTRIAFGVQGIHHKIMETYAYSLENKFNGDYLQFFVHFDYG